MKTVTVDEKIGDESDCDYVIDDETIDVICIDDFKCLHISSWHTSGSNFNNNFWRQNDASW